MGWSCHTNSKPRKLRGKQQTAKGWQLTYPKSILAFRVSSLVQSLDLLCPHPQRTHITHPCTRFVTDLTWNPFLLSSVWFSVWICAPIPHRILTLARNCCCRISVWCESHIIQKVSSWKPTGWRIYGVKIKRKSRSTIFFMSFTKPKLLLQLLT